MKRNYSYLQGGNLPQKKLPKLDDQDIEKLYKYYSSKDKFHKKFQGTKRDYCSAVAGLIENFYQKNLKTFKTPELTGGVKFKKEGERVPPLSVSALQRKVREYVNIDPESNRILTRGVTNPGKKNVYVLDEEFVPRKEPFMFSNYGATKKSTVMGEPEIIFSSDLTMDEIYDHARKYEYFLDEMFSEVAKANFLLCARFTNIIDLTPEGYEDRVNFSSALSNSRLIGKKKSWTETDEAAFRTEYLAFMQTIKGTEEYKDWDPVYTRFYCLQKLFSEEGTYNVVDFAGEEINTEFKGNITEGKLQKLFSEGKRKVNGELGASATISLQVDVKKISEMIFDALSVPGKVKKSNLCIIRYVSNSKINRVNVNPDGTIPRQKNNLPIESIINFNLNKLFDSDTWKSNKTDFEAFARRYNRRKTPRDKTDYVKTEEVDTAVAELVREYFNQGNTATKADGTPKPISKADVYVANKDAKDDDGEPIKLKMFNLNIRNPLISNKLELWSISKDLPEIKTVTQLSNFLMSIDEDSDAERIYDRFCTIGSPNDYEVNRELISGDVTVVAEPVAAVVPEPIAAVVPTPPRKKEGERKTEEGERKPEEPKGTATTKAELEKLKGEFKKSIGMQRWSEKQFREKYTNSEIKHTDKELLTKLRAWDESRSKVAASGTVSSEPVSSDSGTGKITEEEYNFIMKKPVKTTEDLVKLCRYVGVEVTETPGKKLTEVQEQRFRENLITAHDETVNKGDEDSDIDSDTGTVIGDEEEKTGTEKEKAAEDSD